MLNSQTFQRPDVPESIFREYDIRGCAQEHLTPQAAFLIAQAFGEHLKSQHFSTSVCLAHDGRLSSPALANAFSEGLQSQGVDVIFLGLGPTPFLYWAEHFLDTTAGVMVTGSHNPIQDNGFKFTYQKRPFFGEDLKALYMRLQKPLTHASVLGTERVQDIFLEYAKSFPRNASPKKHLKIVWDTGNGAVGACLHSIIQHLPHTHRILHETVDGTFPERSPDPTKKNALISLIQAVVEDKADVGFAFDGDGDRVVLVDSEGHPWMGDELLAFVGEHLHHPSSPLSLVADIKSSPFLLQHLTRQGIDCHVTKTGHVHLKRAMRLRHASLGGEVSGHFFFKDTHWGFDDGLYTAFRLIDIMTQGGEKPSLIQWRRNLPPRFSSPEVRLFFPESSREGLMPLLKEKLSAENILFKEIDGVLVEEDKRWWLIRLSQTEPALVLRWEALEENLFMETQATILHYLSFLNVPLPTSLF